MSAQRYADAAAAYRAEGEFFGHAGGRRPRSRSDHRWLAPAERGTLCRTTGFEQRPKLHDRNAIRALSSLDLQNNRRMVEAEQSLLAVLALQPADPVALNNLAWIYQTTRRQAGAGDGAESLSARPGPQSADTLGWILDPAGRRQA